MSKFNIQNVASFRGFTVIDDQVEISTDEYINFLDELYGEDYSPGSALEQSNHAAFRAGLEEYKSKLHARLEQALRSRDYSDIEWIEEAEDEE